MTKGKIRSNFASCQAGFSLMELMVSLGLSGIVFVAFMALMGQGALFSATFNSSANAIEGISTTVAQLNAVMPQVTRITQCGCRGNASSALSNCTWSDTNDASIWYDPVFDGGATSGYNLTIFEGEFEAFHGTTASNSLSDLQRSNIIAAGFGANVQSAGSGCITTGGLRNGTGYTMRGCKQKIKLLYTPATAVSGSTPSNSGALTLQIGDSAVTQNTTTGTNSGTGLYMIGNFDHDGQQGVGLATLSCGLQQDSGQSGLNFALNLKLKTRHSNSRNTSFSGYESWYRGDASYGKGNFHEVRMKFSFPNISYRGLYQWRALSRSDCVNNNDAGRVVSSSAECCSGARTSTNCSSCKASGAAAAFDHECCSERLSGGQCK